MSIIAWVRRLLGLSVAQTLTPLEQTHYAKFEEALKLTDIHAQIIEGSTIREAIIMKGEELHPVSVKNLIQFRKLNRVERRYYNKLMAYRENKEVRKVIENKTKGENNKDILRQPDG